MRSKFLFMLLFAIAANVYAQNKFTLSLSGYYDVHNRTLSDDFYGIDVVCSYRLFPHWKVGIGTGLGNVDWDKRVTEAQKVKGMRNSLLFLPVEAQIRFDLLKDGITPYVGIKGSYCFTLTRHNNDLGGGCKPFIGVEIPVGRSFSVHLQYAYNFQQLTRNIYQPGGVGTMTGSGWSGYPSTSYLPVTIIERITGEFNEFALGAAFSF